MYFNWLLSRKPLNQNAMNELSYLEKGKLFGLLIFIIDKYEDYVNDENFTSLHEFYKAEIETYKTIYEKIK
ncbi:hypothetical protein UFOVP213_28 [uncultured Caudovirales phage]|uniref:Uncharacterized protein n=1 Tax=uncultured Caudovirales phage TaxID=2100421 RepID=A0A6J7WL31_9CAUD|nr:hypothetical protein UFOVP213_28 [uncultured Caudovirales phage]